MRGMKLRLKTLREQRRLTIDQTVSLTGLSRGFISQLENGKRDPSAETLQQLAEAFNVSIADLIDPGTETADFNELVEVPRHLSPSDMRALVLMAQSLRSRASA